MGNSGSGYVLSKTLYGERKLDNTQYHLQQVLSPRGDVKIYTTFTTTEPFLTDMLPTEKDKGHSQKLMNMFTISNEQACELALAKRLGVPIVISDKQVWVSKAAKKLGIRVKVIK